MKQSFKSFQKKPLGTALWIALVAAACGGLPATELPTESLDGPLAPLPPDPGPVNATPGTPPTPTPPPGESPPPPADPTPTPTPAATPTPQTGSCNLPPNPVASPTCFEEVPSFEAEVTEAQHRVSINRPDLFVNGVVIDQDAYVQEVARVLRVEFGLCAEQGGPPDEVAVKVTNNWNDQYDIVIGSNFTTWTNYTVTCRPARF